MTRLHRCVVLVVLMVLGVLSLATPVYAITVPDSGPYILQVDAYRHLLEDDDILLHIRYNWPYDPGPPDTIPDETIAQAAFVRLCSSSEELARSTIYSYYRRGWGYGSASMYLSAVDAAGWWGSDNLTVWLQGSPTLSWTGSIPSTVTPSINWNASASASAARLTAYSHLISWAGTLGDYWNIVLVQEYADGQRLSSYGETYFTGSIPGLRVVVPGLFSAYIEVPQYTDETFTDVGVNVTAETSPFDLSGMSTWLGLPSSSEVLTGLVAFVVIVLICGVMVRSGIPAPHAFLAGFGLMIVFAAPGPQHLIHLMLLVGVVFMLVVLFGVVFLLRRN